MSDGARTSPYDLAFGADGLDDTLFPPIGEEAGARGHPLDDPDQFVFLTSVGRLLQAIAGAEPGGPGGAGDPGAGEVLREHGRVLYHAYHFWRTGKVEVELDDGAVREVLDDDVVANTPLSTPAPAGYLRLPRNLLWAAPEPGLRPEPADGFFWVHRPAGDGPAVLHLLMTLGVRPDRPGFSIVTASGVAEEAQSWANVEGRPGARDFATTLPGGELDRLYSVETTAELLKLASRCFLALAEDAAGPVDG